MRASFLALAVVLVAAGCAQPVEPATPSIPEGLPGLVAEGAAVERTPLGAFLRWEGSLDAQGIGRVANQPVAEASVAYPIELPAAATRFTVWLNWSDASARVVADLTSQLGKTACRTSLDTPPEGSCDFTRGPGGRTYPWSAVVRAVARDPPTPAPVSYELTVLVEAAPVSRLGPPPDTGDLTFAPPVQLETSMAAFEPGIATAPGGVVYVVAPAYDNSTSETLLWRSKDGGASFQAVDLPGDAPVVGRTLGGGGDSDVAAAGTTVYVVDQAAGTMRIFASHDSGTTWTSTLLGSGPIGPGDRPFLALDGAQRAWLSFHGVGGFVSLTLDGGLTWPIKTTIPEQTCPLFTIFRANDGSLYQVGCDADGPGLAASTNGGLTWTWHSIARRANQSVPGAFCYTCRNWVVGASDAAGTLYVVWSDPTPVDGHAADSLHVWLATSRDKGATWSDPVRVDAAANAVEPWITASAAGRIAIGYYATQADTAWDEVLADWYPIAAVSTDGGATWSRAALTQEPVFAGPICTAGTFCAAGRGLRDYFQIAADERGLIHAAFEAHEGDQYDDPGRIYATHQLAGPTLGGPSLDRSGG